jgi:hypothetical protein
MALGVSLTLLCFHFYYYLYVAFKVWKLTYKILDRFAYNLQHAGLFHHFATSKEAALAAGAFICLGAKPSGQGGTGKVKRLLVSLAAGVAVYFGSYFLLYLPEDISTLAILYIGVTATGYVWLLSACHSLAGHLAGKLSTDVFNRYNESFPQEERLITNPYSINIPARYRYKNQWRKSHINLVNIFRGTLVLGNPGSGKTLFFFRPALTQLIQKGFTLFVYDFKFDDLTRITYNTLKRAGKSYAVQPKFYVINFDDLAKSHRCNPLDPDNMEDVSDATESSRTILLSLNREWISRQGDFFVESAIAFVTANMWFLRKYEDGKYCTLPHLIELIQSDYSKLFSVLRSIDECSTLINAFVSAFLSDSMDQLEGQVASARIALSALASPQLYYILSANEFTLDINNPKAPKVVCMGNNPRKQQIYGAVLSLYTSRLVKLVNQRGQLPCGLVFDEFPTLYFSGMDSLLATGRSNKVAPILGVQDLSQLRKDYGRDQADSLFNIPGNVICGQVTGETARLMSERFGKILQPKQSVSTTSKDTSTSKSEQLESAVPASKIASLSSGQFVGMVADDPQQRIDLKGLNCEITLDYAAIQKEEAGYDDLPYVRILTDTMVTDNYNRIKSDVTDIVNGRLEKMMKTPELKKLIVVKSEERTRLKRGK